MNEKVKSTFEDVVCEMNFGYEDLLLELEGYCVILDSLKLLEPHELAPNFGLANFVLSKRIDFIVNLLKKYA